MYIVTMPIEPLEERYSAQWLRWTISSFLQKKREDPEFNYCILCPKTEQDAEIKHGEFLDVFGTNMFKMRQLQMAIDWLQRNPGLAYSHNTVFWVHDGWFPGIESLAYIRDAMGYNFKIACCLHAGTWDKHDFISRVGMTKWASFLEMSWMKIYDYIFVATEFHKNLILESNRILDSSKIYCTGFPIYLEPALKKQKSFNERGPIVIFPHRLAPEKQDNLFENLKKKADEKESGFVFFCSKHIEKGTTPKKRKASYYNILKGSRYAVSFSLQETWGIAMQEAVFAGCIPIVPDRLSYSEMYPTEFKYSSNSVLPELEVLAMLNRPVEELLDSAAQLKAKFLRIGEQAIPNMLKVMDTSVLIKDEFAKSPYRGE